MDMSPSFISGAKGYFPNVEITFDKFHVKQQVQDTLPNYVANVAAYAPRLANRLTPAGCMADDEGALCGCGSYHFVPE